MKYQGVVSEVPLVFNDRHQVTFATEVCLVEAEHVRQVQVRGRGAAAERRRRAIPG